MRGRLLQILLPAGEPAPSDEMLEGTRLAGRFRDEDGGLLIQLAVGADQAEPVMDRFEQRYGGRPGLAMWLLPVEAEIPRPEPPPEPEPKPEPAPRWPGAPAPRESEPLSRISRAELHDELIAGLAADRAFLLMTALSAFVAAVGLLRNDAAVIIGAMVIAPLLGPNIALALATTLGDPEMVRHALGVNVRGVLAVFVLAVLAGLVFGVDPSLPEIAARTHLDLAQIALALAAGAAGTLAATRGYSGAVVGVMVAVALVPPLVVGGMLLGSGQAQPALGALTLTAANVIGVNLAGTLTFVLEGVRPRTWWEAERARRSTKRAIVAWAAMLVALVALVLWRA